MTRHRKSKDAPFRTLALGVLQEIASMFGMKTSELLRKAKL